MRSYWFVVVLLLFELASCGRVNETKPKPDSSTGGTACVLDTSTIDNCTL